MIALGASLFGTAVVLAFGFAQASIVWQREAGFGWLDIVRLVGAAGVLGGLPALVSVWLGQAVERLDSTQPAARALFWSAPLAAVAAAGVEIATAPASQLAIPMPQWLLPAGCGLILLLGWRRRLFWKAPAMLAPTGWVITAASFWLLTLEWGSTPMRFKGPLPFALLGALLAIALTALGMIDEDLVTSRLRARWAVVSTSAAALAGAVYLPHLTPDLYGFAKLMMVFGAAMGTAHLAGVSGLTMTEPRQRWWAVAGASVLAVSLGATVWFWTQPVPARFGAFSRKSMVGVAVDLLAAGADADDDGFFAMTEGGNDPNDHAAEVEPPALPELAEARRAASPPASIGAAKQRRPPRRSPAGIRHVIIVVVDSLRADILNNPKHRQRFEFLNRLESESVRFANAYSPGNCTRLSFGPMLTGLPPALMASLAEEYDLRREAIGAHWIGRAVDDGGRSALIIASPYKWMLDKHFDVRADVVQVDNTTTPTGHAAPSLARHFDELVDSGFFDADGPTVTAAYVADPHPDFLCKNGEPGGYECYLEEIDGVDRALAHIYQRLQKEGILEHTLLVVTADHGQSFGQMGYRGHASALHEGQIRVALTMRFPGAVHRVVDPAVTLRALPATVADALRTSLPSRQAYESLLPLAAGQANLASDPVMVEHWTGHYDRRPIHQTAFIDGDLKLEYDWHTGHTTLVDLSEPVTTGSDIAAQRPEAVSRLVDEMFDWRRREWALVDER